MTDWLDELIERSHEEKEQEESELDERFSDSFLDGVRKEYTGMIIDSDDSYD